MASGKQASGLPIGQALARGKNSTQPLDRANPAHLALHQKAVPTKSRSRVSFYLSVSMADKKPNKNPPWPSAVGGAGACCLPTAADAPGKAPLSVGVGGARLPSLGVGGGGDVPSPLGVGGGEGQPSSLGVGAGGACLPSLGVGGGGDGPSSLGVGAGGASAPPLCVDGGRGWVLFC